MKLSQMYRTALIASMMLVLPFGLDMRGFAQTKTPQGIKNIVLVHGAWADGSCSSKVIALLEAKGFHVVAVQNPLTSLADDVAATKRIIALQDGPVILVGHSYAGVVITEAGNDPKVVGLVYVAAFAPGDGESINSVSKPYPPAPLGSELRPDAQGFLTATPKGIAEDMAQDLSASEQQILTATQGQTSSSVFGATVATAAWKSKPSWALIAGNDRAIPPQHEKKAATIKATLITVTANHLAMLSHPKEVAELIEIKKKKKKKKKAKRQPKQNKFDFKKENKMTKGKILVLASSGYGLPLKDGGVLQGRWLLSQRADGSGSRPDEGGLRNHFLQPQRQHAAIGCQFSDRPVLRRKRDEAKLQDYLKFKDSLTGLKNPTRISDVVASGLDQYDAVFVLAAMARWKIFSMIPTPCIVMRHFHETSKPTAVLCHGPISLLSALPNSKEFCRRAVGGRCRWSARDGSGLDLFRL